MTITHIYKIENLTNGKCYVGVSKNPKRRFREHRKADTYIGNAIRKHGEDNFSITIIWSGSESDAYSIEGALIDGHGSFRPHGYNVRFGGSGGRHSNESNDKNATSHRGKTHSEATKLKIALASTGRTKSENERAKIGIASKARMAAEQNRAAIGAKLQGIHRSEETKRRMSEAAKRRWNRNQPMGSA